MTTQETEKRVLRMLVQARVEEKSAYTSAEAAAILSVHPNTVRAMCSRWEPPHVKGRRTDGLECYFTGMRGERRVPHHAIVQYLTDMNGYNVEMRTS